MSRLHLFDLDGTLLHGSAAPVEISRQLGLGAEIAEIERTFVAGRLSPVEYAVRVRELWAQLTVADVTAAFEGAPWLTGIEEAWATIRARGEYVAVVSLSPSFFVERLLGWGAHAAHGSVFPHVPFASPIDPAGILDAGGKVKIADALCESFGLARTDCVAYGDSRSDAELFAAVPVSVAVNADHHVAQLATHAYTGRDLREACEIVKPVR
ncbi:HAD hydrolase family protein [Streptomyces sp. YC504]|uniref:HAD hydrolase family protein n=1 Tax=Streptomyces mesophilus TaxID=1775132 RepID=A0A6G4XLD9_9ACTN|nr:haloacid dehalogenase-like hydrolase [Streptomyces mesophilus]NGO77992.1 HAD hydrolase family protein [Streptomyces mesophilus]